MSRSAAALGPASSPPVHVSKPAATPSRPANAASTSTIAAASGMATRTGPAEVAMAAMAVSRVQEPGDQPARAAGLENERELERRCADGSERGHRAHGRGGGFDGYASERRPVTLLGRRDSRRV